MHYSAQEKRHAILHQMMSINSDTCLDKLEQNGSQKSVQCFELWWTQRKILTWEKIIFFSNRQK